MAASAAFTVNGSTPTGAVAVGASTTVTLALLSTSGVNSVAWSIVGNHSSGASNPTITPAGSPVGATASFPMPAGAGQAYLVRCVVNGGVDANGDADAALTKQHIIGVNNAASRVPFCTGEELEREAVYGWTEIMNELSASALTGAVTPPTNPGDDGKIAKALGGDLTYLAGSATGNVLKWNGTAWIAGAADLADTDAVTGILAVANGGTGLSALGAAYKELRVNAGATALEYTDVPVVFAPVMDWATFIALVNAQAALGRAVQMGPGTWTCDVAADLASNTTIYGGPGVIVNCTAGILSDVTNAAFVAIGTPVGSNTTLAANNVVGAKTISVVSLLSGAIADGALVQVRQGLRDLTYTVVGAPTGVGPYTVTLDRPVLMQFAIGDTVFPYSSVPTDIRIEGRGMTITGAMDRFVEIAQAFRCRVSGIRMLPTTACPDLVASFDVGGYDCIFEDIEIDGAGARGLGIALESVEKSAIINCRVSACTSYGIALYDCCDCRVDGCDATETGNGIVLGTDGGTVGCLDCVVSGSHVRKSSATGIVLSLSSRCKVVACSSRFNTTHGIQIDGGASNVLQACDGSDNGSGGLVGSSAATGTVMSNCTADRNTGVGVNLDVPAEVANLSTQSNAGNALYLNANAGLVHITGMRASSTGASAVHIAAAVRARIVNARVEAPWGTHGFNLVSGSVCELDHVTVVMPGGGGYGVNALAGATVRHHDLDLSASALGINAAGYSNVGTLVSGGAGAAQDVTWPDIKTNDHITWTRTVDGGSPGIQPLCTKTASTKFTATFTIGDTSTYEWRVE